MIVIDYKNTVKENVTTFIQSHNKLYTYLLNNFYTLRKQRIENNHHYCNINVRHMIRCPVV